MNRIVIILLVLLVAGIAQAYDRHESPINLASELRDWCKEESEAYFIGQAITPYNWTASYWDDANMLMVEGKWLVNRKTVTVKCRIARGARAKFGVLEIFD